MHNVFLSRALLLSGMAVVCWLGMMLVHELGHVLGAIMTGGEVTRVVWHPLVFSRTDVQPNPRPVVVVWMGPIVGVLVPGLADLVATRFKWGMAYLVSVFAGFCLLANGAYLSLGIIDRIGDVGEILEMGTPMWVLIAYGCVAVSLGFWRWHVASFHLGFGKAESRGKIPFSHVVAVWALCLVLIAAGFAWGDRGI